MDIAFVFHAAFKPARIMDGIGDTIRFERNVGKRMVCTSDISLPPRHTVVLVARARRVLHAAASRACLEGSTPV